MVCNWSPEPPRDIGDLMSAPSQVVVVDSEDSGDEALPGYELLPQEPVELSSDEENQSDIEESSVAAEHQHMSVDAPSTSSTDVAPFNLAQKPSEVEEIDLLYSSPSLHSELTVDCDQVKAAMSGFSLPLSAFPAWACNVPESQWADILAQQIERLHTTDGQIVKDSC